MDLDAKHSLSFLRGGGESGTRIRSHAWQNTDLGSPDTWPQSLRTALNILLTSRYAMWMAWGESLTFLWNDAYAPTLGIKRDWALGRPTSEVWAEIWPEVDPRIQLVLSTGQATYDEGLLLFLERSGFREETYHTFSYSPLFDDSGDIAGMLCVVTEETERLIGERRMATLRDLGSSLAGSNTEAEVCAVVERDLGANPKDLPFVQVYLYDEDGTARLACATGVKTDVDGRWPAGEMYRNPEPRLVEHLQPELPIASPPANAWNLPPRQAAMVPIKQQGQERPAGFVVAGLNPYRRFDSGYGGFIDLIAGQLAAALANARAYEQERQRAEILAELDRSKTVFFSNVSHEFRTPLTLMLGPVENLLAKPNVVEDNDNRDMLQVVHRNGLRLQRLVNTLLEFSRIESGRMRATYEATDLAALTADLASSFRSAMESAGLVFEIDCPALSQPVSIDREMWEKVVLNLVSNAFKYTLKGSVSVRLGERERSALLTVVDTGVGIPKKELPHLFERFHRVEGSLGRTTEGSGIGLAIVAEIVKLHGGAVSVTSEPGLGSTFTVSIPLAIAREANDEVNGDYSLPRNGSKTSLMETYREEALRWLPGNVQASSNGGTRNRVLLADDNADMRAYIHRLLSSEYDVVAVANGQEALDAALAHPPDLVLSDVMMPVLDGFGLLQELRKRERTSTLPVILLSARAGEESKVEGLDAGADDYLVKPFTSRELLARVKAHLSMATLRKQAAATEAELRAQAEASRDRAIEVLESIADGFFNLDRDWRFTYINGTGEQLLGHKALDLLGKTYWDLFPQALSTEEDRQYRRAASEGVSTEFEMLYAPSRRWFAVKAYPAQGGISVYLRDITDRKRDADALKASEERFRLMADSAPVLVWIANTAKECVWFNRPWLDFTGRTLEEEFGKGWAEGIHPDDFKRCLATYVGSFDRREPFKIDYRLRRRDGEWRWILDHGVPLFGPGGNFDGYIGTCVDITDRKNAEAALREANDGLRRANEDLEQFAFSASHDLQEPIRNIAIFGEILSNRYAKSLDGTANEYISFMINGARRMEVLVKDLLAYTQTSGIGDASIELTGTAAALDKALFNLAEAIREANAQITHDALPELRVHEVHLQQLFQNLVGNAIKYRGAKPPKVHIAARRGVEHWQFSIEDNGIGIDPVYKDKIFGLFKRLHNDAHYSGTGIGLALCKRLVERYGGRIWVDSQLGKGSTFYFTIRDSG